MQHLVFEFENEKDCREIAKKLMEQYGVSGEIHFQPMPGGRWRLQVHSEKDLRESTLEKFAQFRPNQIAD